MNGIVLTSHPPLVRSIMPAAPPQFRGMRYGGADMKTPRVSAVWWMKLPLALRAHARRFTHLVGMDGLHEIAGSLPPRSKGRPAIDRKAELVQVLEVYLTDPNVKFQEAARRMQFEGLIAPLDSNGRPVSIEDFPKDLGRRLRERLKAEPDFERQVAERLAREGRLVREDRFPDIYHRQITELLKVSLPANFSVADLMASQRETVRSIEQATERHRHFREAFRDILPENITVRQLFDSYLAAHELIRAEVDTRKEKDMN